MPALLDETGADCCAAARSGDVRVAIGPSGSTRAQERTSVALLWRPLVKLGPTVRLNEPELSFRLLEHGQFPILDREVTPEHDQRSLLFALGYERECP